MTTQLTATKVSYGNASMDISGQRRLAVIQAVHEQAVLCVRAFSDNLAHKLDMLSSHRGVA